MTSVPCYNYHSQNKPEMRTSCHQSLNERRQLDKSLQMFYLSLDYVNINLMGFVSSPDYLELRIECILIKHLTLFSSQTDGIIIIISVFLKSLNISTVDVNGNFFHRE